MSDARPSRLLSPTGPTAASPSRAAGLGTTRRRSAVLLVAAGLVLASCSSSGGGDEVGTGEATESEAAGAGAGQLVGGLGDKGGDETTTTSADAPPDTDTTEAPPDTPPPTTAPPRTTAPPQTQPPATVFTPAPTTAKPAPALASLSGDAQTVYDQVFGGTMPVARSLRDSAQAWSAQMAATNSGAGHPNPWQDAGGAGSAWVSVNEVTAYGSTLQQVIDALKGNSGSYAGYSHVGIGVSTGSAGYYASIRVGR